MKRITTVFGILYVFFLIYPENKAYCLNLGEMITQARNLLRDTDTNTTRQRWSDSFLTTRFNMAHNDVIKYTRCSENRAWIDTTVGIREYELPADCLIVERAAYSIYTSTYGVKTSTSGYKRLEFVTIAGLDNPKELPSWETADNSNPTKYYIRGSTTIGLYPPPSSTYAGTKRLQLDYTVRYTSMSALTDIPFGDSKQLYLYHQILIWYVVSLCEFDKGNMNGGTLWLQKYYVELDFMRKDLRNIEGRWGQQISFGPNK